MGVSIYYTASRKKPLSAAERSAIEAAIARYPLATLLEECGVSEGEFNGENFSVFRKNAVTEPDAVFEGATKLPLCSREAMGAAVEYWCRLLSEVRQAVHGAEWRVHIEDHDIPWDEESRTFDPAG